MEFFVKHQIIIMRSLGAFMLVVGLAVYFWAAPTPTLSENERAAAHLARIEKAVSGGSSVKQAKKANAHQKITQAMRETRKKQVRMLMLMTIIFGVGFLGYSFIKKPKED